MKPVAAEEMITSAHHALECVRAKLFLLELPGSTRSLEQTAQHLQHAVAMLRKRMPEQEERCLLLAAIGRFQVAARHLEAMNSQAAAFESGWANHLAVALGVESGYAYGPGRQDGLLPGASRIELEA